MTGSVSPHRMASARRRRGALRRLGRPGTALALAMLAMVLLCALVPNLIAPHDPMAQALILRLKPPFHTDAAGRFFLLGTDELGRDILSRMIHGARLTMIIGLGAVCIAAFIGVGIGLIAGYAGGWADAVILRLADMQLAFPVILMVIAVAAVIGSSAPALIVILGLSSWPNFARITRVEVLTSRERDYVLAARIMGGRTGTILRRHVLPNALPALLVIGAYEFSTMILLEATLSYLGLGVAPPTPTWGGMISGAQQYLARSWTASVVPGLAIAGTILAINTLADDLRDLLDPRLAEDIR